MFYIIYILGEMCMFAKIDFINDFSQTTEPISVMKADNNFTRNYHITVIPIDEAIRALFIPKLFSNYSTSAHSASLCATLSAPIAAMSCTGHRKEKVCSRMKCASDANKLI